MGEEIRIRDPVRTVAALKAAGFNYGCIGQATKPEDPTFGWFYLAEGPKRAVAILSCKRSRLSLVGGGGAEISGYHSKIKALLRDANLVSL